MSLTIQDMIVEDVPDVAMDWSAGEDAAEFFHIAVQLAPVALVVALAALVVDDEDVAVGAANDAVGTQGADFLHHHLIVADDPDIRLDGSDKLHKII